MKATIVITVALLFTSACGGDGNGGNAVRELSLSGDRATVSDNYELPECQRSIFEWSVQPDDGDTVQIIVHVHKKGQEGYRNLLNELDFLTDEPLSGELALPLSGGEYFFSVERVSAHWTLDWRCED